MEGTAVRHTYEPKESFILTSVEIGASSSETREEKTTLHLNATLLEHSYDGQIRPFFRDHIDKIYAEPTLAFLSMYDQSSVEREGQAYDRLSFGANGRGDIFCILAAENNPNATLGSWHNIFSGHTQDLTLYDEPPAMTPDDIAYRHRGGDAHKRQLLADLGSDRYGRFTLSSRGNCFEELDNTGNSIYPKRQLSSCLLLREQILFDQRCSGRIGRHALDSAA